MDLVAHRAIAGYTLMEVTLVVGIMAVLAAIAWPLTTDLLDRATLATTAETIRGEIRKAQRQAHASGQALELRVDPRAGSYIVGPTGGPGLLSRLPAGLTFGSPDDGDSDGVTFRHNTARFSPRPGLQNSFGSITVRSRAGARRVTVSITGHVSITAWNGRAWQ
ncbi:MAG: GspH/FimT family pseudopilin [Nitrospirota bacterium]